MMNLRIVSWNLCGARLLESECTKDEIISFNEKKTDLLKRIIYKIIRTFKPDIFAFQEIPEVYPSNGANTVLPFLIPSDYIYIPTICVDSLRYPFADKWEKVRKKGNWPLSYNFGQGNAFLINSKIRLFPVASLPYVSESNQTKFHHDFSLRNNTFSRESLITKVSLESGLYLGDRDTEPRSCSVIHTISSSSVPSLQKPQDIFVFNLHLTTTLKETTRSDPKARILRIKQLNIILDTFINRYLTWYENRFPIRGMNTISTPSFYTDRRSPLWVLAGDFNFSSNSNEFSYLLSKRFKEVGTHFSNNAHDSVDFIFLKHDSDSNINLNVVDNNKLTFTHRECLEISDHLPVFANLKIH